MVAVVIMYVVLLVILIQRTIPNKAEMTWLCPETDIRHTNRCLQE